jgi:hypothetical protein
MGNIGAEAAYLDRNGRTKRSLYNQCLASIIVFYCMYTGSFHMWTQITFNSTFSGTFNSNYFFYVNYSELLSLLFVRTRSSIKYLPKIYTIFNITFLMYVNSYMYPA